MRPLLLSMLLLTAAFALPPTAVAHQCSSGTSSSDCSCPPPNDGKAHQHSSPSGACQAAAGFEQSATPGGASQTPGAGLVLALAALGLAAIVVRRT